MTVITIQCHLQAKEESLCYLWNLMTEQNTLLVSEILERIRTHPELDTWIVNKKSIPVKTIDEMTKQLKQQKKYQEMPGRFSTSAETLVKEVNESWFAVQKTKRNRVWGKKRWLTILKSEQELLELTNLTLIELQTEAEKLLKREEKKYKKLKQEKNSKTKVPKNLFAHFFNSYDKVTKNYNKEKKPHLKIKKLIQQCAVVYLLKNKLKFANKPENIDKYRQYRRKKEIQVERLEEQLKARLAKGRNLAKDEYLKALKQAECLITRNEEMEMLQARLLRREELIPFPVSYNTNTDIYWSKNEQGRICVAFNGLAKHTFEVICHNRQLHWFQRFYEDFEIYRKHKKQIPGGLITLRSARLIWKQAESKNYQKPWLTNKLYLHCSVETELWTQEGTEKIRQEKVAKTQQTISKSLKKKSLNKNQQQNLKRNQTS